MFFSYTPFILNKSLKINLFHKKKLVLLPKNYLLFFLINCKKIKIFNNSFKNQKYALSVKFNDFKGNLSEFTQNLKWASSLINSFDPHTYSVLSNPVLLPIKYNTLTTQKSPHVNGRSKGKYIKAVSDWVFIFYLFTSLTWWSLKLYIDYFLRISSLNIFLSPATFIIKKIFV